MQQVLLARSLFAMTLPLCFPRGHLDSGGPCSEAGSGVCLFHLCVSNLWTEDCAM